MTVYALVLIDTITNMDGYKRYLAGFTEVFTQHSGTVLARELNPPPPMLEGTDWPYVITVLISFPDAEALKAWYYSPQYQSLAQHRWQPGKGRIAILASLGLGDVEDKPGKVYTLALIERIDDAEKYSRYAEGFMEIYSQYDGKILALDEDPEMLEGDWPIKRAVLMAFPSEEGLNAWYHSPEYQKLAQHRWQSSVARIAMLHRLS